MQIGVTGAHTVGVCVPAQSPDLNVCAGHSVLMHGVVVVPVVVLVSVLVVLVRVVLVLVVPVRDVVVPVSVDVVVVPVVVVAVPVVVVPDVVLTVVTVVDVEVRLVKRTLYVVRAVNLVPRRTGPRLRRPSHLRAREADAAALPSPSPSPPPGMLLPLSRKTPTHSSSAMQRSKHASTVRPSAGRSGSVEAMLNTR